MKPVSVHAPLATFVAVAMVAAIQTGCSKEEAPGTAPKPAPPPAAAPAAPGAAAKGPTPVNEADLPKIPIRPGYKYYIGGPFLNADKYGTQRIKKFQGEVAQPPSRGMVFGVKIEGDKYEYTAWGNGRILSTHRGTIRDGLFWDDYLEAYKNGKVVAKETLTHDDSIRRTKIVTDEYDYETGEHIRTKELSRSYLPAAMPKEMEDEEDADTAAPDAKPAAPAPGVAPAPPAAPATPPAAAPAPPAGAPAGGAH